MTRTDARELLMQGVFQMDIQENQSNELLELLIMDKKLDEESGAYIRGSFETIRRNLIEIDDTIEKYATNWSIKRMPKADLAILRVAVSEILYHDETPNAVAINEAVEMAKKYCTEDSRKFINGVLGSVERNKNV